MAQTTKATKSKTKKRRKNVPTGRIYVHASFNNTIVTFTDLNGKVLTWASAGSAGFKGSRKGTAYAAQVATETAAEKIKDFGMKQADAYVKGIGQGRESAIRALLNTDIMVKSIKDVTGVPHNGCRPRKPRRI